MSESHAHIEGFITFLSESDGGRQHAVCSGYRPAHGVRDDYLTTGIHHYPESDSVALGETARVMVTFIAPEHYPHCLSIGKEIAVQEGGWRVATLRITRIMESTLDEATRPVEPTG